MRDRQKPGVSFVVPVHNGRPWIRQTLEGIFAQADGRPMEVIVVDDRSRDGSSDVLRRLAHLWPLEVITGEGRGAAAAINAGVRAARFPIICQVDQDVVLKPGWMALLTAELEEPGVAASQGYYETDHSATVFARAMGLDLEHRYARIPTRDTDHVCTGNSAYRTEALREVGLFNESLGYGYDNDMSYRLRDAGYRLTFCRQARSIHRWREGVLGYCAQQYGFGYGRLDVVAAHPRRLAGDSVSPVGMMAHPVLTLAGLIGLTAAIALDSSSAPAVALALISTAVLISLALERLAAGIVAARRFRSLTPLLFPLLHFVRDLAWVAAILVWCTRRLRVRPALPAHSMQPGSRRTADLVVSLHQAQDMRNRTLCLIPAYNEAASLPFVVRELRAASLAIDILIIDDGSTDATTAISVDLDVRVLRLNERLGIGNGIRAGLRYAERLGYGAVIRIDGDGQHRVSDIAHLLAPISSGRADVVLGSRYAKRGREPFSAGAEAEKDSRPLFVRVIHKSLAAMLSLLTGARVTDPTSGFWAFGHRAIELLAEHHPTGYPEPELVLLLSRSALKVVEVPVSARGRLGGRTSLSPARIAGAMGRVLLASIVVPLRRPIEGAARD